MPRLRTLLTALLLLAALLPAAARADGDPPSDILLRQDVYYPYPPNAVSPAMQKALDLTVARAKQAGYELKLALVAAPGDLGSVSTMFGQPQPYADLLTQELTLTVQHGSALKGPRVLAVQPAGFGGNNLGDNAGPAMDDLTPQEGGDGLARTAAQAVARLARADGKPFPMPALPTAAAAAASSSGGGGVPTAVIFGAPVLLIVLVLVTLSLRGKADAATSGEPASGPVDAPPAG